MFERLLPLYEEQLKCQPRLGGQLLRPLGIHDFDWALHPGGKAIIDGVAEVLQLSEDQLQATREIYRTRGNSSSASVLIVLDQLRSGSKRTHIVATSFGPGLAIEMALLRRCQVDDNLEG
jgi:type III polyketide synthase